MKLRAFAAAALLLALVSPASAGIAQIVGSGTGGNIGTQQNNSTSPIVITTNTSVPAGSLIVVGLGMRANNTFSSCTDSAGNTYSAPTNKQASQSTAYSYSVTSSTLASGGTISCASGSTLSRGAIALAFSGSDPTPLDAASATPTTGTGTAVSVGPTGTLACPTPSGGGNCEVLVGVFSDQNIGTVTEDAAFTNAGTLTTISANTHVGFKFVTTNTAVTYAPTASGGGTWSALLPAFISASGGGGGTVFHGLSAIGAGK